MTDKKRNLIIGIVALLASLGLILTKYIAPDDPQPAPSPTPSISAVPAPSTTPSSAPPPSPRPTPSVSSAPSPKPSQTVLPSPSPSPITPSPIPSPSQSVFVSEEVLDTFERPEFALASKWKNAVSRTILSDQVTSMVLRSKNPCALISVAGLNVLVPYTTTKPSAPSYPLGTFYDAMKPIDSVNCVGAKYLQLDVTASVKVGDAQITVVKKTTKAPVVPTIPLAVEFNNWVMVQGYCNGGYCNEESKALQGLQLLKSHRISPYKGVPADTQAFWQSYVNAMSAGTVYMGWGAPSSWMPTAPVTPNAYSYIIDEPAIGNDFSAIVAAWAAYPWVKPMMTGPLKQRDYRAGPNFAKLTDWPPVIKAGIKKFTVVAEQFCHETWAGSGERYACKADYDAASKEVNLYISNMSHGNEGGGSSGAPDLVIDRSGVEPFGFFLIAMKYDVTGLLYYDSIQGWQSVASRSVWTDAYQFGGHGDGLLLMPDVAKKTALPTMRLKLLREASQLADIVSLAGLQADAKALVTNTLVWQRDMAKIEALRTKALGLIQ